MQDYAKLYRFKHDKMESSEKIRRIKMLIKRDIPPLVMLACILMIMRLKS